MTKILLNKGKAMSQVERGRERNKKVERSTGGNKDNNNSNNNNEYTSRALNPSVSNLHEAQSAVHVQLKPSKQRCQESINGLPSMPV